MLPGVINPFYDQDYPPGTINNPYGQPLQGGGPLRDLNNPIFAELLKSLGMNMTEGPPPAGQQGPGNPMFTNYDQQTGAVNPRSQAPYDKPVTPETIRPYSLIQNMQQLAALTEHLKKAGVPQEAMQQIITAQTGGAIRDPQAERVKETKREFDLRQEEVGLKRQDVRGAQQAREATATDTEQRRRSSLIADEVNRLESQRQFITKYGGQMPAAQLQAEVDTYNQRHKFVSDMTTSLNVQATLPDQLDVAETGGFLGMGGSSFAAPKATQQPATQPQALGGKTGQKTMRIKNNKTGKEAEGPEGAVPDGWVRTR